MAYEWDYWNLCHWNFYLGYLFLRYILFYLEAYNPG